MIALVVTALLAQAPAPGARSIAVVLTGRSGMPEARALQLAQTVSDGLVRAGVQVSLTPKRSIETLTTMGFPSATECQGRRPCVASPGLLLRVWAVIGVSIADLDGTTAVHVELVNSGSGERLTDVDVMVPSKVVVNELGKQFAPSAPQFTRTLEAAANAPKPAEPAPAPRAETPPVPQPAPKASPALETYDEPASPIAKNLPAAFSFGAAGAAGVTSAVLLVLGILTNGQIDVARTTIHGLPAVSLTQSEALTIAGHANTEYTASLVTVLGAAAFIALGVVLLLTGDST
jgi:hypothetical protein